MSEMLDNTEPKPQDPKLLPVQLAVKEVCEEIIANRPEHLRTTFWDIPSLRNAEEVQQTLRASTIGDLLLKDGDTLAMLGGGERYGDLNLFVGQATLTNVGVRAWGWHYDKYRTIDSETGKPPYEVITYPGEKDWVHQLDIWMQYSNGLQTALQTVSAYTSSMSAGSMPRVSRNVSAPAYAEMGYEGHNQVGRPARDESEVTEFIQLVRLLIDEA